MLTDKILDALEALPDTTPAEYDEKLKRLTEAFGADLCAEYQKAWDDPPDGQAPAPGVATPSIVEAFIRLRFDEIERHNGLSPSRRIEPRVTFDGKGRFEIRYFDRFTGREFKTWAEIDRALGLSPLTKVSVSIREVT